MTKADMQKKKRNKIRCQIKHLKSKQTKLDIFYVLIDQLEREKMKKQMNENYTSEIFFISNLIFQI